ncbi:hypothetical protein PV327_008968 [Microctonus hyperodae]|uniref:Single domain-containing protein n=1 Tax=Microctonus hyperodae TaxID=165561 RepID=A0AA39FST3_MICHY|nr:hypothetical protein PV327_008968 [Microctonus hyperodae]
MKNIIFVGCLLMLVHVSMQISIWDDNCHEDTPGFQEVKNLCFHIACPNNVAQPHACMNDICPPGQNPVGRESDDNSKTYPGCCGKLICQ